MIATRFKATAFLFTRKLHTMQKLDAGVRAKRPARYTFNRWRRFPPIHGFGFSDMEEKAISDACLDAEKFMQDYGKGIRSRTLIDPAHAGDYSDYRIINPLTDQ